MTEPLLKRGMWEICFVSKREAGEKEYMEFYRAGVYETAQEAFLRGNKWVADNQDILDEQSDGKAPDMMVLELVGLGAYPSCMKEQFIFYHVPEMAGDVMGPYLDLEGVIRPSYLLAHKEDVKGLLNVDRYVTKLELKEG